MTNNKNINKWIRSTFGVSNQKLVKSQYNAQLLSVINRETGIFGDDTDLFKSLLRSKQLCRYQSTLIRTYFSNPAKHLSLDCDRLIFTIDCSKNDIANLLKPISKKKIARVCKFSKSELSKLISIKKVSHGKLNNTWKMNKEIKQTQPFYSHAFLFQVNNNRRAWLRLYVADGVKNGNGKTSIRVDFIPDRFNDKELIAIFGHLRSRLSNYRYQQLFSRAKVKRIDFGLILPGVLSTYFYAYRDITKKIQSSCWPLDKDKVKETTYLGNSKASSHIIIYEKLLKEAKDHKEIFDMLNLLAVTTRCEFRFLADRNNKRLNLTTMFDAPNRLDELKAFDPKHLYLLSDATLESMLKDKTQHNLKSIKRLIRKQLKSSNKRLRYFKIDEQWLIDSKEELMNHYSNLVLNQTNHT